MCVCVCVCVAVGCISCQWERLLCSVGVQSLLSGCEGIGCVFVSVACVCWCVYVGFRACVYEPVL